MKKQVKEKKIVEDVKEFVVKRKTWYRGKGSENSCLLNDAGRMCCLGFYAEACGLDRKTIRDLSSPRDAVQITQQGETTSKDGDIVCRKSNVVWSTKLVSNVYMINIPTCNTMMEVNDNKKLSDEERETKLTALFKRLGIKVKFQ
jgi:hypothetical protein